MGLIRREYKISEGHTRIVYEDEDEDATKSDSSFSVVNMINRAPDGSKLEKKMSESYLKNIQSRTSCSSDTSKTIYPGDYGSGKKVR